MSLNLFSVRHLRPEVELMYCACADIIVTKVAENGVARPKWRVFTGKRARWIQIWREILTGSSNMVETETTRAQW